MQQSYFLEPFNHTELQDIKTPSTSHLEGPGKCNFSQLGQQHSQLALRHVNAFLLNQAMWQK